MNKHEIFLTDQALTVKGPELPGLEKALTYKKKHMVQDPRNPRIMRSRTVPERAFQKFEEDDLTVLVTLPGFLNRVMRALALSGSTPVICDTRRKLPPPALNRMHGFRFDQENMTRTLLSKDQSGILKAVTRYGKTAIIANVINAYPGLRILLIAPGVDLLPQLCEKVKEYCPDRKVAGVFSGSTIRAQDPDVIVASPDSLHKVGYTGWGLVLVDEPHAVVTEGRLSQLLRFNARKLAFGATTEGRFDGTDILIEGVFGNILVEKTYKEARAEGAICPIRAIFTRVPFSPDNMSVLSAAYKRLFASKEFKTAFKHIEAQIPKSWQTLFFVSDEKSGNAIVELTPGSCLAMDKLMKNKKERRDFFADLNAGSVVRCVCSNIYSTGVTIDNIRAVVNCAQGGANILSIQKPGRLAEIKPDKDYGLLVDWEFYPVDKNGKELTMEEAKNDRSYDKTVWSIIMNGARERIKCYREIGYDVRIAQDYTEFTKHL